MCDTASVSRHIISIWRTKASGVFFPRRSPSSFFVRLRLVQCRLPADFDSCLMEQCGETVNASLDTSFNNTNPSLHSSRLSNGASNSNVSFLKRRLFEDEDEDADVSLLPDEDDEQASSTVTSTQKPKSPPRCDSETEVRDEKTLATRFSTKHIVLFFSRLG